MFINYWPKNAIRICHNYIKGSRCLQLGILHKHGNIYNCSDGNKYLHSSSILQVEGRVLKMPSLSPTMMEGSIIKWVKAEGENIQAGDIICDIQTDKAVIPFEVDDDGILAKILVQEDAKEIKIGTVIALMVDEGEDWKSVEMPSEEVTEENVDTSEKAIPDMSSAHSRHNFGPSVRLLLEKYGLKSGDVTPSGPHSLLLKGDVLKIIKDRNLSTVEPEKPSMPDIQPVKAETIKPAQKVDSGGQYIDLELSNMRKIIARRLTESKQQISHTYSTVEVNLDPLLDLRKKMKLDGFAVSLNDLVIKCLAASLLQHPEINCVWSGNELVQQADVDISVAVATPSGLITPIVRRAHALGVQDISDVVKDLATRAKVNKLKPEEFQGGTFTISNLGMFGIKEFTAIINPPQCAILAVGGGQIVLGEDGLPVTKMRATLSYDQMAISDDAAANFLQSFHNIIENPITVLLGAQKSAKSMLGLL